MPNAETDVSRLAQLVEKVTGNVVPEGQYPHLFKVFERRARESGMPMERYLAVLEGNGRQLEWRKLLPDITIKESFLFRIGEQFEALSAELLPSLVRQRPAEHVLRFWSAGCARGEEPSTLAMVLAESPAMAQHRWEILATDVDEEALDDARRGEYGERAVSRVPPHLLRRYFEAQAGHYVLTPELRDRITYRPFNLLTSPYASLGESFDVILLRNVLIYFNRDVQQQVVSSVTQHLACDGYLFLGHSESLWQLNDQMEPVELRECFAYRPVRVPEEDRRTSPLSPEARMRSTLPSTSLSPSAEPTRPMARPTARELMPHAEPTRPVARTAELAEWAAARKAALQEAASGDGEQPKAKSPSVEEQFDQAVRALKEDRLGDAQELLACCLPTRKADAFAHALRGLIHDLGGEPQEAVSAYRAALFLDPELYQVRFLLAARFEHLGLRGRARNEYRQVLTTLENGRSHDLASRLPGLLPSREEIAKRCRRALSRPTS